ncbi:MAG: carboxypeptidase regulatory-like domain-containing protein [Planctomycetota bacterium]
MARGAALTGRVLADGAPLSGVRCALLRQAPAQENGAQLAEPRELRTDQGGEFRFDGLAPGTYRLDLSEGGRASRALEGLVVVGQEVRALGEIALDAGAALRVTVQTVAGDSPLGLIVEVAPTPGDDPARAPRGAARALEVLRRDGVVELTGLSPGPHQVTLLRDGRRVLRPIVQHVDVAPDAPASLTFELAGEAPAHLTVTVTDALTGEALVGAEVVLWAAQSRVASLGATDASGAARGLAPRGAGLAAEVSVDGLTLGRSAPFDLAAGASLEVPVALRAGMLVLTCDGPGAVGDTARFELTLRAAAATEELSGWQTAEGPLPARAVVGRLAEGRYDLVLRTSALDPATGARTELAPSVTRVIDVRAGAETSVPIR